MIVMYPLQGVGLGIVVSQVYFTESHGQLEREPDTQDTAISGYGYSASHHTDAVVTAQLCSLKPAHKQIPFRVNKFPQRPLPGQREPDSRAMSLPWAFLC